MARTQKLIFSIIGLFVLLPIFLLGFQNCSQGFQQGADESAGIEFNFASSDIISQKEMEHPADQPLLSGVNYKIGFSIKTKREFDKLPSFKISSVPEDSCLLTPQGEPEKLDFEIFCNSPGVANIEMTVNYTDNSTPARGRKNLSVAIKSIPQIKLDGEKLYTTNCGNCHGKQASGSSKAGASVNDIADAIGPRYEAMNVDYLLALTAYELRAIAAALIPPGQDIESPKVSITSPTANQVLSGTFKITATATDNVKVAEVQFFVDNKEVGSSSSSSSIFEFNLNTTQLADGIHSVFAQAVDSAGNIARSGLVNFQIGSSTPPPPINGAQLYADLGCQGCHGPVATSEWRNTTRARFDASIININGMKGYSNLTNEQRDAIVKALNQ